jgi:integrase
MDRGAGILSARCFRLHRLEQQTMQETIKVHVVKYNDRPNFLMRYVDPFTGKQISRSTKTTRRDEAVKVAGKWEKELQEGTYHRASRMTWAEFRVRYELEKLALQSPRTLESWTSAANHLERILDPAFIAKIDAAALSRLQAGLLREQMRATTLASHLRTLNAAFSWAVNSGILRTAPRAAMPTTPKRDRTMRGRPITLEEFERMLAKVPYVRHVGVMQRADRTDIDHERRQQDVAKWRRLLHGLWLSGLRLGEALQLSWDADAAITVQTDGRYPMLRIFGEAQKSKCDQMLPIAPEFAEFLLATPPADRHGLVFGVEGLVRGRPLDTQRASRVISDIGEAAGVVTDANERRPREVITVDTETGKKSTKTIMVQRHATAHDLRRAFGTRWSKRVMPATLQKLMRHASIDTTMKYYVQQRADDVAADVWGWSSNNCGNTDPIAHENAPASAGAESSQGVVRQSIR